MRLRHNPYYLLVDLFEGFYTISTVTQYRHKESFKKLVKFPLTDCSSFYAVISREYEVLLAFCFVF